MSRKRIVEFLAIGVLIAAAGIASASETITYSYDAKGRLILVSHAGTVNNNVIANYTFDTADNRKNLKVTGAP
jgi:3-phosphoglycerate kinase